jgi:O-antigen/teichoic acid export membrane protein
MYILQPWKPGLAFELASLKDLLRFGLPYQINTFLAVAKDDGMTVFLGGILGPANMGLLGWAQKWATQALRLVMDPVTRVTFPAFSRMQDHPEELSKAITKSIFFICLLVFPALIGLVLVAPALISLIPKYSKWELALLALGLVSINSAWAAVTTPLTNALNAIGKIKTTFHLMIMWTVLTWVFLPGLSYLWGVDGAALGYAIVGSSSIVAILVAVRSIQVNFWESVGKPLLGAILMGTVLAFGRQLLPVSWMSIFFLSFLSLFVYALSLFILVGASLLTDIKRAALDIRGRN